MQKKKKKKTYDMATRRQTTNVRMRLRNINHLYKLCISRSKIFCWEFGGIINKHCSVEVSHLSVYNIFINDNISTLPGNGHVGNITEEFHKIVASRACRRRLCFVNPVN